MRTDGKWPVIYIGNPPRKIACGIDTEKNKNRHIRYTFLQLRVDAGDARAIQLWRERTLPPETDELKVVYEQLMTQMFDTGQYSLLREANQLWAVETDRHNANEYQKQIHAHGEWAKENKGTYVEIAADGRVLVHYISMHKPKQHDEPRTIAGSKAIDVTQHSPKLAQMLRQWRPHAASAQASERVL